MEKTYHLSDMEKDRIMVIKLDWFNLLISQYLGRHISSIAYFIKNKVNKNRKPGIKQKLKQKNKSIILREINNKMTSISKIKRELDLNINKEII